MIDFLKKPNDFTIAFIKSIYSVKYQFFIKNNKQKKTTVEKRLNTLETALQTPNDNQNGGLLLTLFT